MKKAIILILFSFFVTVSFSQSVGIGTSTPNPSAQLDVFSNNKGFLPPRVALVSINVSNPVLAPATGLLVYNTATAGNSPNSVFPGYYYWNGSMWSKISQDNSQQLPGITIKNFNELVAQNAVRTFTVPTGKVWKLNYWNGGAIRNLGNVPLPATVGTDLNKYDLLLNQNDSFSITGSFLISISEYSAFAKTVKTFNDSVSTNATKSYVVPANKIWKLNFCVKSLGLSFSVGNPSIQIEIPNLSSDIISAANIFLTPNTEILFSNYSSGVVKYFFSVSEFDE